MKRAHRISSLAYAALVCVLAVLIGVAVASAFVTAGAASCTAAAVQRANLFAAARFDIGAEESLERKYRLEPSQDVLSAHREAGEDLTRVLRIARGTPGKSISALVDTVLVAHRAYTRASHRMFAAVDAGDAERALALDHHEVDPVFTTIQTAVFKEAGNQNKAADIAIAMLLQTEHIVLAVTVTVSLVGMAALFVIFAVLRRYKFEVDAAIAKEMTILKAAALTDYLTGLGNHRAYQESFRDQAADYRSEDGILTLALVDVDELGVLNDRRGHATGDRLLTSLAKILRSTQSRSTPYRLGGDEFALTFSGMPLETARARMEHVRAVVESELGGMTVSIGLAMTRARDFDPLVLRDQADAALYEAKRRGRNNTVVFDEIRSEAAIFAPARVAQVRQIIEAGAIGVAFQPIWDVDGRSVIGYEALARPTGDDPINPQDAFDIAENIGKAHELDRVCRDAILAKARALPAGSRLFINVSPQSFDHEAFEGTSLVRAVTLAGLSPDRIVLEITERSIARLNVVVREAQRLRALGFALALDDAGSGNAGLEMLSQLDVDYVKIDREVIVRARSRGGGRAVLAGIVAIAHEMGAQIIAEGIEDAAMLDLVMKATSSSAIPTAVQGYFLGRPKDGFVAPTEFALIEHRLAASQRPIHEPEYLREALL